VIATAGSECRRGASAEGLKMKVATVRSVCECQAHLAAELDEHRVALRGWARDARKLELPAPANTIGAERERFDVGWACPFCTRNVLRSFSAEALAFREVDSKKAS
jgi:Zn finger protein HypA/HybF involved in hydrogenase expression